MKTYNQGGDTGIGFLGAITILFIGLKLAEQIAWSWWWIFAPLWLPLALVVCGFTLAGIYILLKALIGNG